MRIWLVQAMVVYLLFSMYGVLAATLTDQEKQTLREAHDAYIQAIAERHANPGHLESSFAIAMQKHAEAEQLAMQIGRANKSDAIPFLVELQDQRLLRSFSNTYTAPTSPETEALVLKHLKDPRLHPPEMSADIWGLIHQYHSRVLFDALLAAIKEELDTPPDPRQFFGKYGLGGIGYLTATIVKTDLPGIEPELVALLPRLTPYDGMPVARFLADRRYLPAEKALIDFLRRIPADGYQNLNASYAVLPLGTQPIQDAVVQRLINLSRLPLQPTFPGEPEQNMLNRRDQEIRDIVSALEISSPMLRLNRQLLGDKVLQGFTPEQTKEIVAMLNRREQAEKNTSEPTASNLAYWAQWRNRNDVLGEFIRRGVDVNAAPASGDPALIVAANYSNYDGMRLLLEAGANPDTKDKLGRTALFILAGRKSFDDTLDAPTLEATSFLIAKGANVSAAIAGGWTPLHIAVAAKFRKMVELLVAGGANVNAEAYERSGAQTGIFGLTPLQVAEDQKAEDIAIYLRSKGAKLNYSFKLKRAEERAKAAVIAPLFWGMH
jgi:ankyrin repeat protein